MHEHSGERTLLEAEQRLQELHRRQQYSVHSSGSAGECSALELALVLQWRLGFPATPKGMGQLTHGRLHYPASMQPAAALALLRRAHSPGGTVCDCFCGSGTVLIEALRCGRNAIGADASPLASFVAQMQATPPGDGALREAEQAALGIAQAAHAGHVQPDQSAPMGWGELLTALKAEESCSVDALRCLWFAYASALERGSRKKKPKAIQLFLQTLRGYVGGARYLREVVGLSYNESGSEHLTDCGDKSNTSAVPWCHVSLADARSFVPVTQVDSIITSVPYPGVYKYKSHARWMRSIIASNASSALGTEFLDTQVPDGRDWPEAWSSANEIGDRKQAKKARRDSFSEQWQADQDNWVAQQANWLRPGGRISVVVGDGKGIDTNSSLQLAFKRAGLTNVANATITAAQLPREQREPGRRRTEHVILGEKANC